MEDRRDRRWKIVEMEEEDGIGRWNRKMEERLRKMEERLRKMEERLRKMEEVEGEDGRWKTEECIMNRVNNQKSE
jgi:hypothetical protein